MRSPEVAAEPTYPPDALAARLAADVVMDVDLDAAGQVTNVHRHVRRRARLRPGGGGRRACVTVLARRDRWPTHPGAVLVHLALRPAPRRATAGPDAQHLPADGNVTIWIVVHDERAGQGWISKSLRVLP
jgi:hypothetical protein